MFLLKFPNVFCRGGFIRLHLIFQKTNMVIMSSLKILFCSPYVIHHWRIFRRKLAWVGFQPTTIEFCSDALTDWPIKPWVQLPFRPNFLQLLQFHLFVQCSHFISAIALVSRHICFKRNLAEVIKLVVKWIDRNGIYQ